MKYAQIIVGAGYGDEGKGLMTDYFCHQLYKHTPLVIRYNGGAQAGHTVVVNDNKRYVFSHLSSGTPLRLPTYLTKEFIVNPILFNKEYKFHNNVTVYVHPHARVTTPYDMLVNQIIENSRTKRHGSCGVGIYETILRNEVIPLRVSSLFKYLEEYSDYKILMNSIKEYSYNRLISAGIEITNEIKELLELDVLIQFYNDLDTFINHTVRITNPGDLSDVYIFEGAQGLLLSEKHGIKPHLTPSDPGIATPLELCKDMDVSHINVCYTTRCYTTRHGSGPLENEKTLEELRLNVKNETNITNEYQGNFRYAPLAVEQISDAIHSDFQQSGSYNINTTKQIAITCIDQLPTYTDELSVDNKLYLNYIRNNIKITDGFYSIGPSRSNVHKLEEIWN